MKDLICRNVVRHNALCHERTGREGLRNERPVIPRRMRLKASKWEWHMKVVVVARGGLSNYGECYQRNSYHNLFILLHSTSSTHLCDIKIHTVFKDKTSYSAQIN